jgi:AcrR family transcriptional regulator
MRFLMPKPIRNSRTVRPLKSKGLATRATILDAAHDVFKDTGYYGSSISEITRRCGISMGTFYHYFKNKEQVFLELNDEIISRFMARAEISPPTGLRFEERLRQVIQLLMDHTRDNFAFHRILGESELIDRVTIAYYDSITQYYRDFFLRETRAGQIRSMDLDVLAYGLTGICYFNSLDWETQSESIPQEELVRQITDILVNGISGPSEWKKPADWSLWSLPEPKPLHLETKKPLTKGGKTRQAILRAAEKVIGQRGINRANISEITREAGVAQGTFYVHFKSKADLIDGFVRYINHAMRQEVERVVSGVQDRRDAERVGILTFLKFLRQHREIYRVVPECEMISREVAQWYYQTLARGYIKGLRQGIERGEIRPINPTFIGRSLMGFVHFIALKKIVWNPDLNPEVSKQLFKDMIEFILFGLKTP